MSSNIVEGYALRRYKQEYIHYLAHAFASSLETIEHFDLLKETESLDNNDLYESLVEGYTELIKMVYSFIRSVESHHDPARVGNINK